MYVHTFTLYDAFGRGIEVEGEICGAEEGKAIDSCAG
jgi:hypothetical protein